MYISITVYNANGTSVRTNIQKDDVLIMQRIIYIHTPAVEKKKVSLLSVLRFYISGYNKKYDLVFTWF